MKNWIPLRIPLTTIHFYTCGSLFPKVNFKDLQFPYCPVLLSAVLCICLFFHVNKVKTEGFQTKEVINNGQWLLGYLTNYFTNFRSQVPKHVSRRKKYCIRLTGFIIHQSSHYFKKKLNVTGKIELNSEGLQNHILPLEFIHSLILKNT